jgi:hypothetical protein
MISFALVLVPKRHLPSTMLIENLEIDVKGRGLKIACLHNEWYDFAGDPSRFVGKLKGSGVRADLFTFLQEIHEREPRFQFHREHDSAAVLPVSTHDHWWKNQISDKTRNMIRKSAKSGVELRCVEFDDDFVRGVMGVYQESPVRQGKRFWHYGKDFETNRRETGTFRDRSRFVGAYYKGEMIGFSKLTRNANSASLMCIISMMAHRNKAPSNALIAKAVEMCAEAKIPYLKYGFWSRRGLGEFKIKHGFVRFDVPRFYVPLNSLGQIALQLRLYRRPTDFLPETWVDM